MTGPGTEGRKRKRKRKVAAATALAALAALAALVYAYPVLEHWEAHATGSYNCPSGGCTGGVAHNYNFFSGWGSDWIPSVITVVGLLLGYWWHNQCNVAGCYWLGLPHKTASGHRACVLHHPESKLSHLEIHALHHAHRRQTTGEGQDNAGT